MLVSLIFLIGAVGAVPTTEECPTILRTAGVTETFAPMVAHSIHSLTLEDIRYFFKEDATEENGIPTVNMDLTSDTRVLPNALLAGYDDEFSTRSMKTFDLVMRNMNRTWWGITNYNTLDKLTHAFHMAEIWDKTAEQYRMVERLLDPESDICECVTDIEENDVLNYLNLLAFKIKYPGITTGNKTITDRYFASREKRSAGYNFKPPSYNLKPPRYNFKPPSYNFKPRYSFSYSPPSYSFGWKRSHVDFDGFDFDLSDVELLKDVAEKLVDDDGVITEHVDSAEHWEMWRDMLKTGMGETGYYDLAVFMFCMLN